MGYLTPCYRLRRDQKQLKQYSFFVISLISKPLADIKTILLKTHTFPLWTQRNQPWTKEYSPSWLPSICWKVPWRLLNDMKHGHYQELNHEYNTDLTGKKCPRYKTSKTAYGGKLLLSWLNWKPVPQEGITVWYWRQVQNLWPGKWSALEQNALLLLHYLCY